jgi:hypothetical protein
MRPTSSLAAGAAAAALSAAACAHVEYYDLNQGRQIRDLTAAGKALVGNDLPITNPVYWTPTYQTTKTSGETWTLLSGSYASGTWSIRVHVVNMDSSGWTDGRRNNPTGGAFLLGDTHKVGFANFRLNRPSRVSITLSDDLGGSGFGINPSFTLYRGAAVFQTHDEATVDPLNPTSGGQKVQNQKDTGSVVDSQGITSAYRNTVTNTGSYYGQFNALGGWSTANPAGDWSAVQYVTSVTGHYNSSGNWQGSANSNSLTDYPLPVGDYIIAFSGNAQNPSYASARSASATSPNGVVTNLGATLTLSVVADPETADVPMPPWALLIGGLALAALALRASAQRGPAA